MARATGTAIYNGSITLPIGDGDLALLVDASPMSTPALSRSPYITMNRAGAGDGERLRTSPYLGGGSGRRRLSPDAPEREPLSRAPVRCPHDDARGAPWHMRATPLARDLTLDACDPAGRAAAW